MMQKSKLLIILAAVLILAAAAAVGGACWFYSPGVHFLFNRVHCDIQRECYVLDSTWQKILGQTTVSLDGSAVMKDSYTFARKDSHDGLTIDVSDYQNTQTDRYSSYFVTESQYGDLWRISRLDFYDKLSDTPEGSSFNIQCPYSYIMYLDPEDPEYMVIAISEEGQDPFYVVYASSEADARKELKKLLLVSD